MQLLVHPLVKDVEKLIYKNGLRNEAITLLGESASLLVLIKIGSNDINIE